MGAVGGGPPAAGWVGARLGRLGVARRALLEWLGRNRGGLAVGVLGMIAVALAAQYLQRPAQAPIVVQPPGGASPVGGPRPSPSPTLVVPIAVHVGGEVANPGLYHLRPDARVNDAVLAAGGASPDGDVQRLNLAARLADGQQILVPSKVDGRPALPVAGAPTPARVNINTASLAELDTLPGIGPATAQRIIAYREQHGPFANVEQLREARLVNASTFDAIKDLVTV
jgi:competence protein ComEA